MKPISRRTVLRGAAGTALALPFLDAMERTARADDGAAPNRYVTAFCGCSLGHDQDAFTPNAEGLGYDLKDSLAALGPGTPDNGRYDIQSSVSVISGLRIPSLPYSETPTEPATAIDTFHVGLQAPIFSGTSSHTNSFYVSPDGDDIGNGLPPQGPTSQYLVAAAIGAGTVFPALDYKIGGSSATSIRGCMSYRTEGDEVIAVANVASPQQAYNSLVGQANFGGETESDLRRDFLFRRRLSALDLAADDASRLSRRAGLGAADQRRLDRHFTELRELELRLTALNDFEPGAGCELLADPGPNPAFDGVWANESARATTFHELVRLAFICDLSRTASLMYSAAQNLINLGPATGYNAGIHTLTHSSGFGAAGNYAEQLNAQMAAVVAWHVEQFAQLIGMLADTPDGPDTTLLDHTALVFLPEGGSVPNAHARGNYSMLVAGHAGGLAAGRHFRIPDEHPARVVATAMAAVGAPAELGEISGELPQLFLPGAR